MLWNLSFLLRHVDKKIGQIAEFVKIYKVCITNANLFEYCIFGAANHCLNQAVIVLRPDAAELLNRNAVVLVQVR